MMTSIAFEEYEFIHNRLYKIIDISERKNMWKNLVIVFPQSVYGVISSCRIICNQVKKVRKYVDVHGRPDDKILDNLIYYFRQIRELLISLSDIIENEKILSLFLKASVENALFETDELVENMVIGSDKELKDLFFKLADICNA